MSSVKELEVAVIRRVCFIANTEAYTIERTGNVEIFKEPLWFTEGQIYSAWYTEKKYDSWILRSFSEFCTQFYAKFTVYKNWIKEQLNDPNFLTIESNLKEMVDTANSSISDEAIKNMAAESYMEKLGYSRSVALQKAEEFLNTPAGRQVRETAYDMAQKNAVEHNYPYKNYWSNQVHRFVLPPREKLVEEYMPIPEMFNIDIGIGSLDVSKLTFYEIQYLAAIDSLVRGTKLKLVNFPDISKVNCDFPREEDLDVLQFCFYNYNDSFSEYTQEENLEPLESKARKTIKQLSKEGATLFSTWLGKYFSPLPIGESEEEKENRRMYIQTIKDVREIQCPTVVVSTAICICSMEETATKAVKTLGGESEPVDTVFSLLEKWDFFVPTDEDWNETLNNLMLVCRNMNLDATGLETFRTKKPTNRYPSSNMPSGASNGGSLPMNNGPQPKSSVEDKPNITELLLCLFLGVLGAHKFYRRKYGLGVLYLLTYGLFGIGYLVDLVTIIIRMIKK